MAKKCSGLTPDQLEREEDYRTYRPYGVVVRESDKKVLFFNRDYAPLHSTYERIPAVALQEIIAMSDDNGGQHEGSHTYWFYNDATAPHYNFGKEAERVYYNKIIRMYALLRPTFPEDMRFHFPGERGSVFSVE